MGVESRRRQLFAELVAEAEAGRRTMLVFPTRDHEQLVVNLPVGRGWWNRRTDALEFQHAGIVQLAWLAQFEENRWRGARFHRAELDITVFSEHLFGAKAIDEFGYWALWSVDPAMPIRQGVHQ